MALVQVKTCYPQRSLSKLIEKKEEQNEQVTSR